jgi:hypothetical protein
LERWIYSGSPKSLRFCLFSATCYVLPMQSPAPEDPAATLWAALQRDLQRRIAAVGRYDAETFQTLQPGEVVALLALGIVAPLVLAWWLL